MLLSQKMETTGCSKNDHVHFLRPARVPYFYILVRVLADNFAAVNGIIIIVIIVIV